MWTRRLSSSMDEDTFVRAFLTALQNPEIKDAIKSIVGEQHREDLREELGALRQELGSVRKELGAARTEAKRLQGRVADLEDQVEDLEQYSRRNCLRISGVEENDNEDVVHETLKLFNEGMRVQPPIQLSDIDRIHRLGKKNLSASRPRGIIIKFATYGARARVFGNRRELKNSRSALYINESLTQQRSKLMYKARTLKRQGHLQQVWTHDGSIVVKDNRGRIRSGKTLSEIENLISSLPPPPTNQVNAASDL